MAATAALVLLGAACDPVPVTPLGDALSGSLVVRADVRDVNGRLVLTDLTLVEELAPPDQPRVLPDEVDVPQLEVTNATDVAIEGLDLAVVLGRAVGGDLFVSYAHDLSVDDAFGALAATRTSGGRTVTEALDCLRERTDEATRLDALVEALRDEQADPGRTAAHLATCESRS